MKRALLLSAALALGGCYTTYSISGQQLRMISKAYQGCAAAGETTPCTGELTDDAGRKFKVGTKSDLTIVRLGGEDPTDRYSMLKVSEGSLIGRTVGGEALEIPLPEIAEVRVKNFSAGKTVLAVVGGAAGTAAVVSGLLLLALIASGGIAIPTF